MIRDTPHFRGKLISAEAIEVRVSEVVVALRGNVDAENL
jgi:hypothetical protein